MPGVEEEHGVLAEASHSPAPNPLAQRLVRWFNENDGELSPDVQIVYSDSSGYHCRASRPLASPAVAKCPLSLTLSYLNLDHNQSAVPHVDSQLNKCLGHIPSHVLTYLLLVEQKLHSDREQLRWYPYIACLPEPVSMTTPLWFDSADMNCLVGTNLAREADVKLQQLVKEWSEAMDAMHSIGMNTDIFSFDWFRWAATIISSRAFISTHILPDKETFPILFPVVDILNHSPTAKVEWDFRPLQTFTLKILDLDQVHPGDELFNNYAPKQNDELLLGYGFAVPDNPVEQFAIKMVLPPPVEEAARRMRLFEPSYVPFGMPTAFLDSSPTDEPQYLRPRAHPFGSYQNDVPFLRGIPPWIAHMFFIRALMNLRLHPDTVDIARPDGRIILEVLLLLYEAIDQKTQTLVASSHRTQSDSLNQKQKYATIYRDGQVKLIRTIRDELRSVLYGQRVSGKLPPTKPAILSTTEAFMTFQDECPSDASKFAESLSEEYGIDSSDLPRYDSEIAGLEFDESPAELLVWKLLLGRFAELASQGGLISGWVRGFRKLHPGLDVQGSELAWAEEVVEKFAFPLVEGEGEVQRICMYMNPWKEGESDDDWVYAQL